MTKIIYIVYLYIMRVREKFLEHKEMITSFFSCLIIIIGVVNGYYKQQYQTLNDIYNILSVIFLSLQSGLSMNMKKNYNRMRSASISGPNSNNSSRNPFPSPDAI